MLASVPLFTSNKASRNKIMKDKTSTVNLSSWIWTLSKLFGYWPLDTNLVPKKWRVSTRFLWLAVPTTVYIVCTIIYYDSEKLVANKFNASEIMLVQFTAIVYGCMPIVSILLSLFNGEHLQKILEVFARFDKTVSSLNIKL